MRRSLGVFVAVLPLAALVVLVIPDATPPAQAAADKQLVCHVTGNEGAAHIINVADPAVPAHLGHGDCLINSTNTDLVGDPCNPTDANGNDICDIQP